MRRQIFKSSAPSLRSGTCPVRNRAVTGYVGTYEGLLNNLLELPPLNGRSDAEADTGLELVPKLISEVVSYVGLEGSSIPALSM